SFTDRLVDLIGEGIDLTVRIGALQDTPDLVARFLGMPTFGNLRDARLFGNARNSAQRCRPRRPRLHCGLAARARCCMAIETAGWLHHSASHSGQTRNSRL